MDAQKAALRGSVAIAALLLLALPATAGDMYGEMFGEDDSWNSGEWEYESEDETVSLRGSIGALGIEAKEYVFNLAGSSDVLSLLTWQSAAPTATAEIKVTLPDHWTIKGRASAALFGDSYMEDYDWLLPYRPSFAPDDWTDRSRHPNTNLDWYLDGSLAVGKDVLIEPGIKVNLNGGLKYTDVQWTARGGDFTYSVGGFRDTTGTFPDVPGITYRQQLPVIFLGADVEATDGQWTYRADAKAGMTLFGLATDNHWMRDLRFLDYIEPTPMVSLHASAAYDFTDNFSGFIEGGIEKMLRGRADTAYYDIPTDTYLGTSPDVGGAELGTISLSAGLKGSF
jgi:outer membrane protease